MKKPKYKFIIYFIVLLAIIWGLMFVLKKVTKNVESGKKMAQLTKTNFVNFISTTENLVKIPKDKSQKTKLVRLDNFQFIIPISIGTISKTIYILKTDM